MDSGPDQQPLSLGKDPDQEMGEPAEADSGCLADRMTFPICTETDRFRSTRVDFCTMHGEIHRLIIFLHLLPQFDQVHTPYQLMTL